MADQTGSMTGVWDGEKIHRNLPLAAPILPGGCRLRVGGPTAQPFLQLKAKTVTRVL
jgi:hypothetical protein